MKHRMTSLILALCAILTLTLTACDSTSLNPDDGWVPAGYQLASNKNLDYVLFVPQEWTIDMSTGVVTASTKGGNISMMATANNDNKTLTAFWDEYKTQFDTTFADFKYVLEGQDMLLDNGKVAAKKYVYTATVTGTPYQFMQVIANVGDSTYIFTFTALANQYNELIEKVDGILSYLSFEHADTPAESSVADTAGSTEEAESAVESAK